MSTEKSRGRRVTPQVERLEQIQLMAADVVSGIWTIRGTSQGDVLVVSRDPADPTLLKATRGGEVVATRALAGLTDIRILGRGGDDTIRLDESNGAISVAATIRGGGGRDRLTGGSGRTILDGGAGDRNILIAGSGQTTLLRGVAPETTRVFGSADAFRRFLKNSVNRAGRLGVNFRMPQATVGAPTATPDASNGGGAGGGSHSTTNVQVAGVDEADIVETDGKTLYLLSRGELLTIDARDPASPRVLSRTTVEGSPLGAYLDGSRLTVISSVWTTTTGDSGDSDRVVPALVMRGNSQVKVTTYDVSDPSAPSVRLVNQVDGWYSDSRLVDGKLYLVVQNDLLAGVGYGIGGGGIGIADVRVAAPRFNTRKLANAPLESLLPSFESTATGATGVTASRSGLLVDAASILQPSTGDDPNLLTVAVFDTRSASAGPLGSIGLLGAYASTLHVSGEDLFLFSPDWDASGEGSTNITQLSLKGNDPTLVATGTVKGTLINQYAADSHEGTLRVATTQWRNGGQSSGVYVLRNQGGTLKVTGRVENLAPGESLFAARFDGDRAYLVTFEQVDPLFTIDLSEPDSPRLAGELKVPGFSRFLQPVGEGYLLGIGREVDPATNQTLDIKLSLFDVRDLARPTLVTSTTVANPGTDWNWSSAEWDPHAFGFFPETATLAVPVQGSMVSKTDAEGNPIEWTNRSALEVFRLDVTAGASALDSIGSVQHGSGVNRSVRIGDVLYSIAEEDVKSVRLGSESLQALGSLIIQTATSGWPAEGTGGTGPIAID